jgi:hypothetical protein
LQTPNIWFSQPPPPPFYFMTGPLESSGFRIIICSLTFSRNCLEQPSSLFLQGGLGPDGVQGDAGTSGDKVYKQLSH